jgi:membrane protease subunit (stomatin/prohibitin family)
MTGFMGMGMAQQAGGMNATQLFQMGQQQQAVQQAAPAANSWTCSCGATATGKFCTECGSKEPEDGWKCTCGSVNKGKFCPECGAKKPAGIPQYRCDKCGWQPADPTKAPRFCPECGDPFDSGDLV